MKKQSVRFMAVVGLTVLILGACRPRIPAAPPVTLDAEDSVSAETPEPEASPTPTPLPTLPPSPLSTSTPPADLESEDEWARYVNEAYGLTFSYPGDWTIEFLSGTAEGEAAPHAVGLTLDTLRVRVEFRRLEEESSVGPGSLPDGQIEERDVLTLLGRPVPKYVVVFEGKDKAAFVGERFAEIEIYIEMGDDRGEAYAAAELSAADHDVFDRIVGSVERIGTTAASDLYPGWESYSADIAPGLGLGLRYPPTWTLSEGLLATVPAEQETHAAAVVVELSRETYQLLIQYKQADEATAIGPDTTPEGIISEGGTVPLLGTPTERYVIVHEDRLKMVFLTYQDERLELYIALTGDPQQIPYTEIDLPETVRHEMDQIVTSIVRLAE